MPLIFIYNLVYIIHQLKSGALGGTEVACGQPQHLIDGIHWGAWQHPNSTAPEDRTGIREWVGRQGPQDGTFWQAHGCLCFRIHGNQGTQTQGGKEEGGWLFACPDPSGSRVMGTSVHIPPGVQA